jgi:luciferase family oxidoreductase group 1
MRLSVLDQSPISASGAAALRNSVDLARRAEALGFHRYWVAEHHGTPALACASPEVLIATIASATSRLRVGSGGVMLPHYSPLKVAETFSMLAGLFPGRIDLGIGRAAGTDPATTFALQRDRRAVSPEDFPQQLAEMLGYLRNALPRDHPFARLAETLPGRPEAPEVWLLGSSPQSGIWAAEAGLPYAFADFIAPTGAPIANRYRREFERGVVDAPRVIAAVTAVCAESDDEAQRLASSSRMLFTLLREGTLVPVPRVETALRFFEERGRDFKAQPPGRRAIVGAPETVRDQIEAVAAEYGADEMMIVTITHDHAARVRSYELIAAAFDRRRDSPALPAFRESKP